MSNTLSTDDTSRIRLILHNNPDKLPEFNGPKVNTLGSIWGIGPWLEIKPLGFEHQKTQQFLKSIRKGEADIEVAIITFPECDNHNIDYKDPDMKRNFGIFFTKTITFNKVSEVIRETDNLILRAKKHTVCHCPLRGYIYPLVNSKNLRFFWRKIRDNEYLLSSGGILTTTERRRTRAAITVRIHFRSH